MPRVRVSQVAFTNSLPPQLLLRYFGVGVSDSMLLRLFVVNPFSLDVYDEGVKVNASSAVRPQLTSPSGFNQFNPQSEYCMGMRLCVATTGCAPPPPPTTTTPVIWELGREVREA